MSNIDSGFTAPLLPPEHLQDVALPRKRKELTEKTKVVESKVLKHEAAESARAKGTKRLTRYEKNAQDLISALDAKSEAAVEKVLKRPFVEPTSQMVQKAINERLSSIAIKLLNSTKNPFDAQAWLGLFQAASQMHDLQVAENLLLKLPPNLPDEVMCELLRHSVLMSPNVSIYLINQASPATLKSDFARDFLFGCLKRANPDVLQALSSKGVIVEALYPPRLEATYAAEVGSARQIALEMVEKQRLQPTPLEAKIARSAQTVVLMPKERLVIKTTSKKAREDEELATNLFHLAGARGIMASAHLQDLNPSRLGLAEPYYEWSFHPQDFDQQRLSAVASKLDAKEQAEFLSAASKSDSRDVYLVPDIQGVEENYAQIANTSWNVMYVDASGKTVQREVTFKGLQKLYLEGMIDENANISPLNARSFSPIGSNQDLWNTLSLPWNLKSPLSSLSQIKDVSFTDIQAKPFAKGMKLLGDLKGDLREKIFARLDTNSEINATLLTELQFYDLHEENLGLIAKRSPENTSLMDCEFTVRKFGKTLSFYELLESYLKGQIKDRDGITFTQDNVKRTGRLEDFPELQAALKNTQYEFVIFDIDINFAETNSVHFGIFKDGATGHFIPFRSCILQTPFKDKPLSHAALNYLSSAQVRDRRMLDWLTSKSSVLYHHMRPDEAKLIYSMVEKLASNPKYSLSLYQNRSRNPDVTVAELREMFKHDLGEYDSHLRSFWRIVGDALVKVWKPHIVQPGDTLETIAQTFSVSVGELLRQNPKASKLSAGMPITIKPDLTGRSPRAKALREEIAAQLFPKATHFQIEAFKERIQMRDSYLQSVRALQLMSPENITEDFLREIIERRSTPLSHLGRAARLAELEEIQSTRSPSIRKEALLKLHAEILQEIRPTQFNLMKAVYPLLGDVWVGLMEIYKDPRVAGSRIGYFFYSIEDLIKGLESKVQAIGDQDPALLSTVKLKLNFLKSAFQEEIERSKLKDPSGNPVCEPYF